MADSGADRLNADTRLTEIPQLSAGPRRKLQSMGVETLADLARKLSRSQLKQARQIGPKTIELIEQLLCQAQLKLRDIRALPGTAEPQSQRLQAQVQAFGEQSDELKRQVAAWVRQHRPEAYEGWSCHRQGGWGEYLQAQLLALNEVSADPVVKREFEHQLVRSLHRYRRQQRYAGSREALLDGITARGRLGPDDDQQDSGR